MSNKSHIEQQVMASVGVIYTARKLFSYTALEVYVLAASVLALWRLVWVHQVFANFFTAERGGLNSLVNYVTVALEHTHIAVQLTLLIAAIAATSLFVDAVRSFVSPSRQFAM